MADLIITGANVIVGDGADVGHGTAGATVTAGQVVYGDPADSGKLKLADNNSATAGVRKPKGIALHAAAAGQPLAYVRKGPVTIGATLALAATYYLSDTPGGICPAGDLAAGEYPSILGVATSTTVLMVNIQEAGAAVPA